MDKSERLEIEDKNGVRVSRGDIIDIHQTVNGYQYFIILNTCPLDIRYGYDATRLYEYNKDELVSPCKITGCVGFEIVGSIYSDIPADGTR